MLTLLLILSPNLLSQGTATYHLHVETNPNTGFFLLKTADPDFASLGVQSTNLKNRAAGEYFISGGFDTLTGVPNASGSIPAGSVVNFTVWMKRTTNFGTMYPRLKLNLNASNGTPICTSTGPTALTTTLTQHNLTCTTPSAVSMTNADRFYLWTGVNLTVSPGNHTVNAELDIEGTLNGNYDSRITVPLPVPQPVITSLSPSSGPVGSLVTVVGSNFGASQGSSTLTFNGQAATPSSWSSTQAVVPVPVGATTGPVVITVTGVSSNSPLFTVVTIGGLSGTISRSSDGTPVADALVEAIQSNVVKNIAITGSSGTYLLSNLISGTYDVRVTGAGYIPNLQSGVSVTGGGTTTLNLALSTPGAISGKVTQSDGTTPITQGIVRVNQGGTTIRMTTSNGSGDYSIAGLSPGIYDLQASAPTYSPRAQNGVTVGQSQTTPLNFALDSAPPSNVINYFYDELQRLAGVVDPSGDTVGYSYDSVGNLLSISRQSSSSVSILEFTPNNGSLGTAVTILGTGFSSSLGENVVKFNGTTAMVSSSSATQIVASVPAQANSGPITVTTTTGMATSSAPFTVGTSVSPTITGISPTVGTYDTPVTISGTNFEAVLTNNRLSFNTTRSTADSGSATALTTRVPLASTSGRIRLVTPSGNAVSNDDFIIPPSPFSPTDIEYTNRMSVGESRVVAINTAGKIGLLLFDGTAGQKVVLRITNVNVSSDVSIYKPDGSNLGSPKSVGSTGELIDEFLPTSGTYTILIDPQGSGTGSLALAVSYAPQPITSTITIGGPPVILATTLEGQDAKLTFAGSAGQRVSLTLSSASVPSSYMSILGINGTQIAGSASGFIDTLVLPSTGIYTILVDPDSFYFGSMTLTLYSVPPSLFVPIVINGSTVTVNIGTPGQNGDYYTFTGTASQQITIRVTQNIIGHLSADVIDPDEIVTAALSTPNTAFDYPVTLVKSGTYKVQIDPTGARTGTLDMRITSP